MRDGARVFDEAAALIRKLCNRADLELTLSTPLADLPDMDSLRIMETVAMLEARFGVEVDTHDLDHLFVVADIVGAVLRAP